MAVVTFMSDFGYEDHYVAAVKAAAIAINPSIQIIDITHQVQPFDVSHAAYVLSNIFRKFPKGTVHLVALDTAERDPCRVLVVKLEDHFFVGFDNGILSLISNQPASAKVEISTGNTTFTAKDVMAPIAAKIAGGQDIYEMGKRIDDDKKLFARQPKLTKREIVGNVIRVDHYGNLITNIIKPEFDKIQEINGNVPFEIQFGREKFQSIHTVYSGAEPGECYIIFNSDGNLQVGINKGNASELLGLRYDSPIYIHFNP